MALTNGPAPQHPEDMTSSPADRPPGGEGGPEVGLAPLLRAARGTYSIAIRRRLAGVGCADLPGNGPFLLGGLRTYRVPAAALLRQLGMSRQSTSQLVDAVVRLGYVTRDTDPQDRRRQVLTLTERGRVAADAVRAGVEEVDGELARMLSPGELDGLRAGLLALVELRERWEEEDRALRA